MLQKKKKLRKKRNLYAKRRTWSCGRLSPLFCWLFLCNSTFPSAHLCPAHRSPLSISFSAVRFSPSLSRSLSPPRPLLRPAPAARPAQLTQRRRLHSRARPLEAAVPRAPCAAGGRAAPPRPVVALGSGDAPCMSPHPWIVTTRNNRNKVNKSENK